MLSRVRLPTPDNVDCAVRTEVTRSVHVERRGASTCRDVLHLLELALYLACDGDSTAVVGGNNHLRPLAVHQLGHLHV